MSSPLPDNPYEILGVSKDAQLPEIRSAHRKRVLKCHPDKVQDPALKAEKQNEFQKVQQAYEILSNESEREKYDNQVRVAELRKQAAAQAKANSSAPRSSRSGTAEFEVHYASPRPSHRSSPSTAAPPTFTKVYYSTRSHSDEDRRSGPRVYDAEPRAAPTRRESSFAERETRPSKRESEREREREKDRERERERERRKKADREAKAAKEAKELRREEKKAREKQQAKEMKRQAEEKRRYMTPPEDDLPPPRMEKKSSSSRKYEPREPSLERERDFGYNDFGVDAKSRLHEEYAENYINAARVNAGGEPRRSKTYHGRTPYVVPSPPPPQGVASAYPSPDEDEPRRSSASARRRGSADAPKMPREKSYSKPSRERLDEDPIVMEARPPPGFPKSMSSAAVNPGLSSSPPRPLPRTNTMPTETTFSRPVPGVTRAKTFTEGASPRGRTRSKMEPQVEIESEEEDVYEQDRERERRARDRDARDRKHRSNKKHRSPERYREEPRATHTSYTYSLNEEGGAPRTKLSRTYTRRLDPDAELYDSYGSGARYVERPPLGVRESSYSSAYGAPPMTKFPKVRTTKLDDVQYSKYPAAYAAV